MPYEKLDAHDKLDVKHRERYVHGLPFEDKFFEDNGIILRDRNNVTRDIVQLYNHFFTDSRRIIAFKGYQTGKLLQNLPDTVPLINLDTFDCPEMCDMPDLPFAGRCECHYWHLHCCKQACVYYAHWMANKINLTNGDTKDLEFLQHRLEALHISANPYKPSFLL